MRVGKEYAQRAAEAAAQASADAAASSEQTSAEAPRIRMLQKRRHQRRKWCLQGLSYNMANYYYDEMGNYVTGWFDKNDNRYCARDDGRLYKDGEHEIDSTKYLFDRGGVCLGEVEENAWKQGYLNYIQQEHKKWIMARMTGKTIYWS